MTGKNRHYIPRFYQGYFLSCTDPSISYKKKEFHYYLSLIMKGDRNEEIKHTKGKDYFEKSGQEDFGLNLKNDQIITRLENIEIKHLKQIHDWLFNENKSIANYDYNLFFEKFILSLYIRSITSKNKLRLVMNTMIENLLTGSSKYNKLKEKLDKVCLKDSSTKYNEKTNFCKQWYNIMVEMNLEILNKKDFFNFSYCKVIHSKFNIPLTDIILLNVKENSISIVEDIENCDNLIFLLNKNTLIYYAKNDMILEENLLKNLDIFLISNAKDFVITEEKIDNKILKNMEKFEIRYDEFYCDLEKFIEDIILIYILEGINKNTDKKILELIENINATNIKLDNI